MPPKLPTGGPDIPPQGGLPPDSETPQAPTKRFGLPIWYLVLGVLLVSAIMWASQSMRFEKIPYGRFRELLAEGKVREVVLTTGKVHGKYSDQETGDRAPGFAATRPVSDEKLP